MLRRPGSARSLGGFRQNRLIGKSGSAGLLIFRACTVHESSSSLARVLSMAHSPPVTKAVIPAAGLGTRFVPATKAMPKPTAGQKVDINTAAKEDLDALPGIGPVKAQAIIEARPFKTIEDIMKVRGIKAGEFGKIKDMITVK